MTALKKAYREETKQQCILLLFEFAQYNIQYFAQNQIQAIALTKAGNCSKTGLILNKHKGTSTKKAESNRLNCMIVSL